jgi:hypothetical protein
VGGAEVDVTGLVVGEGGVFVSEQAKSVNTSKSINRFI